MSRWIDNMRVSYLGERVMAHHFVPNTMRVLSNNSNVSIHIYQCKIAKLQKKKKKYFTIYHTYYCEFNRFRESKEISV